VGGTILMVPEVDGGTIRLSNRKLLINERNEIETKGTIRIGYLNCSGIRGKAEEIENIFKQENLNVLGCGETWLRQGDIFNGNIMIRKDDKGTETEEKGSNCKRGRRGALLLKNKGDSAMEWKNIPCDTNEFIHVVLKGINIIVVYFPPTEIENFIQKLKTHIEGNTKISTSKSIIIGDFNVNFLKRDSYGNKYGKLEDTLQNLGFHREIYDNEGLNCFTHLHSQGGGIIDHIWTNMENVKGSVAMRETTSDHEIIICEINGNGKAAKEEYKEFYRKIFRPSTYQRSKKSLIEKFNKLISENNPKNPREDINEQYEILNKNIIMAHEMTFKAAQKITKTKIVITDIVKFWIAVRQRMKRKLHIEPDFEKLNQIKIIIRNEIKEIKKKRWIGFSKERIKLNNSEILKKFSNISKKEPVMIQPSIDVEEQIKTIFPMHRKKSGITMQNFKRKCNYCLKNYKTIPNRIEIISMEEFKNVINTMKSGTAPGPSGITYEVYKMLDDKNLIPWLSLFNKCFELATCVDKWCMAITVAIPKKDGSVRPITLLETSRKLLEQLIYIRLIKQIKISNRQCGFMKGKETMMQVVNVEAALRRLNGKQLCVAFLDISKAYDTVHRKKLFETLGKNNEKGVQKNIIKILELLFNFNHTKLIINGQISKEIWLERGLLQGSKLSPILYNVFMNDFIARTESLTATINTMCFMYADDITLISKTHIGLKCALKQAEKHSIENEYKFNVKKCATISRMDTIFSIDKQDMIPVKTFEYLGMIMNLHGVKIHEQINKNINKTRKKWYKAKKSGMLDMKNMPWESKLLLVKAIMIPTLEYGLFFGLQKKHYLKKIQKFITKYIRLVLSLTSNSNTYKTNWIASIELRKTNYVRRGKNLLAKIKIQDGTLESIYKEQEVLPEKKQSRLLRLLKTNETTVIGNKDEEISALNKNCARKKGILKKIQKSVDGLFILKYMVNDLNYFRNGKLKKLKVSKSNIRKIFKMIYGEGKDVGKRIKLKYLKKIEVS
jgi:hypothetical protein